MQIAIYRRVTLSGVQTIFTEPIDIEGSPAMLLNAIGHFVGGTTPDCTVTMQTSDNLQDWNDLTNTVGLTAQASDQEGWRMDNGDAMLKFCRLKIAITGTDPVFNLSFYLHTFSST